MRMSSGHVRAKFYRRKLHRCLCAARNVRRKRAKNRLGGGQKRSKNRVTFERLGGTAIFFLQKMGNVSGQVFNLCLVVSLSVPRAGALFCRFQAKMTYAR